MPPKLKSVIFLLLLVVSNDYLLEKSFIFHIFGFVFVISVYYWYRKLIDFFQNKMKDCESDLMFPNYSKDQICRVPIIWSNRLNYYSSPLLEACKKGDTALVKTLIKNGANIHETNIFGEGAIFLAAYDLLKNFDKKDASCIWALHKAGCSVNTPNKDGFTPLHLAAFKGHSSLIDWLIKKGADCNVEPSPAGLALVKGHKKAAALILAHQYQIPIKNGINGTDK